MLLHEIHLTNTCQIKSQIHFKHTNTLTHTHSPIFNHKNILFWSSSSICQPRNNKLLKMSTLRMVAKSQAILTVLACAFLFLFINYKFSGLKNVVEETIQSSSRKTEDRKIEDVWSYRLNLTSKFIPITDKERNLFAKLKSIQVEQTYLTLFFFFVFLFSLLHLSFFGIMKKMHLILNLAKLNSKNGKNKR